MKKHHLKRELIMSIKESKQNPSSPSQRGFTLIEIMLTILISGILSAVALPQIKRLPAKAKLTEGVMAMAAFEKLTEIYYFENAAVPDTLSDIGLTLGPSKYFTFETSRPDLDEESGGGKGQNKQMDHKQSVCHNGHTITVAKQAVMNAHLDHGDSAGECPEEVSFQLNIALITTIHEECPQDSEFKSSWSETGFSREEVQGNCTNLLPSLIPANS